MTLGQRLRTVRRGQGLTLRDVAGRTGHAISHLSDIERGRSDPSLGTLLRLAHALEISGIDLLSGVDGWASVGEMADYDGPGGPIGIVRRAG